MSLDDIILVAGSSPTSVSDYLDRIESNNIYEDEIDESGSVKLRVSIPGLFNTGVDNNHQVLSEGSQDLHYYVYNGPSHAVVATINPSWYSFVHHFDDAMFIWGAIPYHTTFDLSNFHLSTVQISISIICLEILYGLTVNGNTSLLTPGTSWSPDGNYFGWKTVSVPLGHLVQGINRIDINTSNRWGTPFTGFVMRLTGTGISKS